MNSPLGQSRGGTPIGERALQSARRLARCGGYGPALIGVPLSFSSFVQSMTRKSGYRFSEKVMLQRKSWLKARIVRFRHPPPAFSGEDRCGERENLTA